MNWNVNWWRTTLIILLSMGSWMCGFAQNTLNIEFSRDSINSNDVGTSILELHNGDLIISGWTDSSLTNNNQRDGYIMRFNPTTQTILWSQTYGWDFDDHLFASMIASDGSIVLVGSSETTNSTTQAMMWFLRIDPATGAELASSRFQNGTSHRLVNVIESPINDNNGNNSSFLVTGPITNFSQSYVARLNWDGTIMWESSINAVNRDWTYGITENPANNNIYLSGSQNDTDGNFHVATIVQVNAAGNTVDFWTYDLGTNIIFDFIEFDATNNDLLVTGTVDGDAIFVRIDLDIRVNTVPQVAAARRYNYTGIDTRTNRFDVDFNNETALLPITVSAGNRTIRALVVDFDGNIQEETSFNTTASITKAIYTNNNQAYLLGNTIANPRITQLILTNNTLGTPCSNLDPPTANIPTLTPGTINATIAPLVLNVNNTAIQMDTLVWDTTILCCDDFEVIITPDQDSLFPCNQDSVTFTTSISDSTVIYIWSTNDTTTSDLTIAIPDTITIITVIARDTTTGCQATDTIVLFPNMKAEIDVDDDQICLGETASLTANISNGFAPFSFSWEFRTLGGIWTAISTSNTNTLDVSPTVDTEYRVIVTDSLNCSVTSDTVLISVRDMQVNIAGATEICANDNTPITLTANSTYNGTPANNNVGYTWNSGTLTGNSIIVTPTNTTIYTVTAVDPSNNWGCTATATAIVTINPLPSINITASAALPVCQGTPLTLTATTNAPNLNWDNGLGSNSIIPVPTNIPGTTTYSVDVTDANGCSNNETIDVTVNPLPTVTITPSTTNPICVNDVVTLTANANASTFHWNNGLGNTATVTVPTHTAGTTTYTVDVTDVNGCQSQATIDITINDLPSLNISASASLPICAGLPLELTANSTATTFNWSNGLGNASTISLLTIYPSTTTYAVTVTDNNGCQNDDAIDVEVQNCCWAALSSDYIRLDPENIDSRMADYGIFQGAGRTFRIINGQYNRLPERMVLANDVTLIIENANTVVDATNSDLVFGIGAGISVIKSARFLANNAVFRPCDDQYTWDGITVINSSTDADFVECTFINATTALYYYDNATGSIMDNSFRNCQFGVVAAQNNMPDAISNNIFRVDDAAKALNYSDLTAINQHSVRAANDFKKVNVRFFSYPSLSTPIRDFAGIEILAKINTNYRPATVISQNQFINAFGLDHNDRQFNGIILSGARNINVSDNNFTNNHRSIAISHSEEVSVENNNIEVTRRSQSDETFYQIVVYGVANSGGSLALIKGNTIVNSADVQDLSANVDYIGSTIAIRGSGAIYLYGNNSGATKVIDNDISGFEIGIYNQKGITAHITNNRIKAFIYGIYQEYSESFIGCNDIQMDLDANVVPNTGVTGIYTITSRSQKHYLINIFGNCIKNTNRAIMHQYLGIYPYPVAFPIMIQNNYLYNYTEAGIFTENVTNTDPQSRIRIRRNAFIPNNQLGTGALGTGTFDIIAFNSSGYTSSSGISNFLIGDNFYGDGTRFVNSLSLTTGTGNLYPIIGHNQTDLAPFTPCGNMNASNIPLDPAVESDWMHRCDDEDFTGRPNIAQRTGSTISLASQYQSLLNDNAQDHFQTIVRTIPLLTNLNEVDELYSFAQSLDLSSNELQWLDYWHNKRHENYSAAQTVLNNIVTTNIDDEHFLTIQKVYTDLEVRQATTIVDTDLISDLQAIATHYNLYKHEARAILTNHTTEAYGFEYNPIPLYNTTTVNTVSNNNTNETAIQVFPNPTSSQLNIQIDPASAVQWTTAEIYDVHGRLLTMQSINTYTLRFNVQDFPQGVYMITVKSEHGDVNTTKFIKQ